MINIFAIKGSNKEKISKNIKILKEEKYKFNILWLNNEKLSKNIFFESTNKNEIILLGIQTNDYLINELNQIKDIKYPYIIFGQLKPKLKENSISYIKNKIRKILNLSKINEVKLRNEFNNLFEKFTLILNYDNDFIIITDYLGFYSLYCLKREKQMIFSNSKNKLWGICNSLKNDFERYPVNSEIPTAKIRIPGKEDTILKKLYFLMEEYLTESLPKNSKIGVLFSGGLDSLILAKIISDLNTEYQNNIILLSSGTNNSKDVRNVLNANNFMRLPLYIVKFDQQYVSKILPEIFRIIERSDTLNVSLAIPEYLSFKKAKEIGIEKLYSGQGADEIFLGYNKYKEAFISNKNIISLSEEDIVSLSKRNLERETKLSMNFNVTIDYPYLNPKIISFARFLPLKYKIRGDKEKIISKYILRKLGLSLGIPNELLIRKTAMQYGSGSMNILKKLSKAESLINSQYKITSFLKKYFNQLIEKSLKTN